MGTTTPAESWPESLRLAYCRSSNLPMDTPAETCQKLWRYSHLASIALRTDNEEVEVMALHQEIGALAGWPIVARRALDSADLEIFLAPRRPAKGAVMSAPKSYPVDDIQVLRALSSRFLRCACNHVWDCRDDGESCPACGRRSTSSTPATHAEWREARKGVTAEPTKG